MNMLNKNRQFKLGKNGKKHDYRTLQYNKYNQMLQLQFLKTLDTRT